MDYEILRNLPNIHPGEILNEEFLIPLNITAYRLANEANIPQTRISERPVSREHFIKRLVSDLRLPTSNLIPTVVLQTLTYNFGIQFRNCIFG